MNNDNSVKYMYRGTIFSSDNIVQFIYVCTIIINDKA